jgi:phage terminase large subunit-like protein
MPSAAMPPVRPLRKDAIELPHALGQVPVSSLYEQVVVVRHQGVRQRLPLEIRHHSPEDIEKGSPVLVILVDRLAAISA